MDWRFLDLGPGVGVFRVHTYDGYCRAHFWDFGSLMVETLTEKEVLKRAKDRNPSFEYDLDSLLEIFGTMPKDVDLVDGRVLKLKYYVEKIPFHYHWDLKETEDQKDISKIVAIPILLALKQTRDRETELLNIIRKKDQELQEYRKSDMPLINKFIITKPVDVDTFHRSTIWDSIVGDETVIERVATVIPGFNESGYIPVELSTSVAGENEESTIVNKPTSKATKRKILTKIQKDKIGGSKPVEFKYSHDSQEMGTTDDEPEATPAPPPPKIVVKSTGQAQKPGASQIMSKRKLRDVL